MSPDTSVVLVLLGATLIWLGWVGVAVRAEVKAEARRAAMVRHPAGKGR